MRFPCLLAAAMATISAISRWLTPTHANAMDQWLRAKRLLLLRARIGADLGKRAQAFWSSYAAFVC